MSHLNPRGVETAALPTMLSASQPAAHKPAPPHRHLDRDHLRIGVAHRREMLAGLEMTMVTVCEAAAARSATRGVRIDDRATWDRPMWARYLDAAAQLEPEHGPPMRRLFREIDHLERLIACRSRRSADVTGPRMPGLH